MKPDSHRSGSCFRFFRLNFASGVFNLMLVKFPQAYIIAMKLLIIRAGGRAVDLGRPSGYHGGPKFEIKHKSRCLQKSKLVDWGAKHVDWGAGPLLPPALILCKDATTRLGWELNHQPCDHGRRKNDAANHSVTLPNNSATLPFLIRT